MKNWRCFGRRNKAYVYCVITITMNKTRFREQFAGSLINGAAMCIVRSKQKGNGDVMETDLSNVLHQQDSNFLFYPRKTH